MSLPEIKIKVSVLAYEKRKPLTALSQLNNDAGYVSTDQLDSELLKMREWVKQQFLGEVAPLNQPLHGITILQRNLRMVVTIIIRYLSTSCIIVYVNR